MVAAFHANFEGGIPAGAERGLQAASRLTNR